MDKGKKDYHHGNLRPALLEAALGIISEQGLEGLSMRTVAAAANVSHNAPYRHFANKEAILAAVAEEGFRELGARMVRQTEDGLEPMETLMRQSCEYVLFARQKPAHFEVMFAFTLRQFFDHQDLLKAATTAIMELIKSIHRCQEAGIVIKRSLLDIAFGAWCMVHGLATLVKNGLVPYNIQDDEDLVALVRRNALLYWEGVKPR